TASTDDDEISYEGGIGDFIVSNSGTEQNLDSSEYWIDSSLIGTTQNGSTNSLAVLLEGGASGIGGYEFTISAIINEGGAAFPPCQNDDSDESVDWTISVIALEYTLTEIKS
ncbi:MAG: hypothetical protein ACPHS8_07080, partial [Candidatus Poseidoniaceae archaeon]